jgi:hypothetical protein
VACPLSHKHKALEQLARPACEASLRGVLAILLVLLLCWSNTVVQRADPSAVQSNRYTQKLLASNVPLRERLKLNYDGSWTAKQRAEEDAVSPDGLCSRSAVDRKVVNEIQVTGYADLVNWTEVTQAMTCMPHARRIYWEVSAPMPNMSSVLREHLPQCELYLTPTASHE